MTCDQTTQKMTLCCWDLVQSLKRHCGKGGKVWRISDFVISSPETMAKDSFEPNKKCNILGILSALLRWLDKVWTWSDCRVTDCHQQGPLKKCSEENLPALQVKSSKNYATTARLRRALASAFHSSRNKKLKIASLLLPRPPLPFHLCSLFFWTRGMRPIRRCVFRSFIGELGVRA